MYSIMYIMKSTTFTELRNNAKKFFDSVESGESVEVYRNGKLIAIINPASASAKERWRSGKPLRIDGASLSKAVLEERDS